MPQLTYQKTEVRASAILTTSYVAGDVIGPINDENQIVVLANYTKGSSDSAEIKIEFSPDNSTWYQESFGSISGGTDTISLAEHTIAASGLYRIPVPVKDNYVRVSVKGTGTMTSSLMDVSVVNGRV